MLARYLAIAVAGLVLPLGGYALGIRVFDHDSFATARGDAFVATADNASAIYYNPAGISQLRGTSFRGGLDLVHVESQFDPTTGRKLESENDWVPLPSIFCSYTPENCPVSFGLGFYVPYGLSFDWPDNGPFRDVTIHGELKYQTLNPIISWQVTETLSIAAGPTFNHGSADLTRGIALPDDEFKFTGSDWAFGATAGILWHPLTKHSFGISYRSPTTMQLDGQSRALPYQVLQEASVEIPLPQVIIAGYSFRPTPKWNLEVDFDWTDWERLNTLVLKQSQVGDEYLPFNWNPSYAVEFGVTRYFDNGMRVSGGYVFLENSVPTSSFTPLVPDQNLHVFSLGLGGHYKRFSWDATYQFTYGPGRDVSGSLYGPTVSGNYSFTAQALSLSFGYQF